MKSSTTIKPASCRVKRHSGLSATLDNSVTRRGTGAKHDELEAKHRLENRKLGTGAARCHADRQSWIESSKICEPSQRTWRRRRNCLAISGGGASRYSTRPNRLVTM